MTSNPHPPAHRGASLMEAVIAVGVIAMAVPLVLGTLAESGESGLAAQAETRSSWIIPACMDELQATRHGVAQFLPNTQPGQQFPPGSDVWALAFSADGRALGKVSKADYEKGVKRLENTQVRYLATLKGIPAPSKPGVLPLLNVTLTLEFPATVPAAKRQKIAFHTRMP